MKVVERHQIDRAHKWFEELEELALLSKNLYNLCNYYMRQNYFEKGKQVSARLKFKELSALVKATDVYQALPTSVGNRVVKQVIDDWSAWKNAILAWKPSQNLLGEPKIPKYKHKTLGRNSLIYDVKSIQKSLKNTGKLCLPQTNIKIETQAKDLIEVRVLPKSGSYAIELVYEQPIALKELNSKLVAGIDLGIDNLAAVVSNKPGFRPILVDGKKLKSINQGYNQRRAELKKRLPPDRFTSKQIQQITNKRNQRVIDYLHKASRLIVDRLVKEGIGRLVIGQHEAGEKVGNCRKISYGDFVKIPHNRLIEMITYKAQLVGIEVTIVCESYTSKTSFLDLEPVDKQESYQGERVKRGLFRSAKGIAINADCNGAFNIIRKVSGNSPFLEMSNRVEEFAVSPVRVSPVQKNTEQSVVI